MKYLVNIRVMDANWICEEFQYEIPCDFRSRVSFRAPRDGAVDGQRYDDLQRRVRFFHRQRKPERGLGLWLGQRGEFIYSVRKFFSASDGGLGGANYWQATDPVSLVPLVGENVSGAPYNFGTVMVASGVLWVHPGPSTDVLVQFTAPTSGTYTYSGLFELLDTSPSGVIGEIYDNGTKLYTGPLTGPGANQATLNSWTVRNHLAARSF